jgi:hypothetical protein
MYLYGWTLSLAALALALRFVPYSDDDGTLNAGWAVVMATFGLVAVAASIYLVVVLEILKFKRFRERELRRQVETGEIAALSQAEIEAEAEREVETGEFQAVRPPDTGEFQAVSRAGEVTLAFRRWEREHAKAGGRQRTPVGELAIESVAVVERGDISERDARRAGHRTLDGLLAELDARGDAPIWRIELRWAGEDPRRSLRERADLDAGELQRLSERLARLDRASRHGPWTLDVLALIARRPAVRAAELAAAAGRDKQPFKRDVRKLKELGLTESLETGYRLSPRGRALMEAKGVGRETPR